MSDPDVDALVAIVERGMEAALRKTGAELTARLASTQVQQAEHRAAGRSIEASACAIRAQALREAIACLRGNALAPLRARVSAGIHTAERSP